MSPPGSTRRSIARSVRLPWIAGSSPAMTKKGKSLSPRDRALAGDGGAVEQTALAVIVVDRVVQRAAIVPDRQRALVPAEAAGELRANAVLVEEIEQRPALGLGHVGEAHGVDGVHEQRLA